MGRAVGLDDQLFLAADEIRDERPNRRLAYELVAAELAIFEVAPDDPLGARRVATQRAGAAGLEDS
jgi:hypothetical protein